MAGIFERTANQHILTPPILLTPDALFTLTDDRSSCAPDAEAVRALIFVDGLKHVVMAPGNADLCHIEHALARHFNFRHHMLTIGAVVYQFDADQTDMNMTFNMAHKYRVELQQLEEDPIEAEWRDMARNWLGYSLTYHRADFWKYCKDVPSDLRRELVEFSVSHPPCNPRDQSSGRLLTTSQHEAAYFQSRGVCVIMAV